MNPKSAYATTTGFGWTRPPEAAFARPDLHQSRTSLTVDGVSGSQVAFRADVDPGSWHLTIWLETTGADHRWPQIRVQGEQHELPWTAFRRQDEPGRSLQKLYRVFRCIASVKSDGLSLEVTGNETPLKVLGLSLIRCANDTDPQHDVFLRRIAAASHYRGANPLDALWREADSLLQTNPADAFFAIWRHRLELLTTAERYYAMRGWQWADDQTGLGMFDRQHQAVMLLDGLLVDDPAEMSPLTERALFFRGRLLHWLGKQRGGADAIAGGNRDLKMLAEKHPDDQLLAIYLGERVDTPDACDRMEPTAGAPAWSNAQREALCRLRQLIHWWVENRQSETGELGGKFGDDVEILRWWAPLCLAGDETAIRGWQRLADGVWRSKHIFDGYARKLTDVEHSAEFVSDTAPLMLLYSDDPRYEQRLAPSVRHFESLWTGTTANGNRFFRSAWFNAKEVTVQEPKGRDVEYNTRAVQAVRYLAWRQRNPTVVKLLHQWSTAWARAAMRSEKGKPKGIFPASIRFSDEAFNGDGPNWYQAGMYWSYFDWEHYRGSLLLDQLLFTYSLTSDERLLRPMFSSLELIRIEGSNFDAESTASRREGSSAWAAAKLAQSNEFWNVVEQWRVLFGDGRWDDLIMQHGTSSGRYWVSKDEQHLVDGLNGLLEEIRYNTPMRTTEAVYTDRVRVPGVELLKAMLTGDGIKDNLSPYYSVSWQKTGADFTALVTKAESEELKVQLFNHGPEERQVLMRVWRLTPGEYRAIRDVPGTPRCENIVTVRRAGERIPVMLPSRRLLTITLKGTP